MKAAFLEEFWLEAWRVSWSGGGYQQCGDQVLTGIEAETVGTGSRSELQGHQVDVCLDLVISWMEAECE